MDTTYFLPAVGVSVKELPNDAPLRLTAKGHRIIISDISIFELSAKASKHITNKTLTPERVTRGLRAIIHDDAIETISIHDNQSLLTAFKLHSILHDFIDCLILSSAINHCDTLITEDNDIRQLTKSQELNELLTTTNLEFKIQKLTEII